MGSYIREENKQYEGCTRLNLNIGRIVYALPPAEINGHLEDLVVECARLMLHEIPGIELRKNGLFCSTGRLKNGMGFRKSGASMGVSLPVLIDDLKSKGYNVPEQYWEKHSHEIFRHLKSP